VPVLAFGDLREYIFFVEWGETESLLSGPSNYPLLLAPDDRYVWRIIGMLIGRPKPKCTEGNLPLCSPQILHGLHWD
jgi:hypothetical protein